MKSKIFRISLLVIATVALNLVMSEVFFRIDLTSEKRFTLAEVTRNYLRETDEHIFVTLYLGGDLNPGFTRLRNATTEMLDEMDIYAAKHIHCSTIDPSRLTKDEGKAFAEMLESIGRSGVPVFETKEDGQKTRTIVYPYAQITVGEYVTWVDLLENLPGLSGDENLNRSIENLEYKIIDGIRRATTDELPRVAFLEGHGELSEVDVVEVTDALSQHFAVDRGAIANDASVLDGYKVIIVAKPTEKFSEKDKFVLDQYLMRGGKVIWFVDAVTMTLDSLRQSPNTIGLLADFNIDDMLFRYGVRLNPEVVEDINCSMVPISVAQPGESSRIVPMPWRFSPLLSTNMLSPITRNVNLVRGDFAGYIDTVGENMMLRRVELLRTSNFTKANPTPVFATLNNIHEQPSRAEFSKSNLCVAILEEGVFTSVFAHRNVPKGLNVSSNNIKQYSEETKMIVVADGDIIRNDVRFRDSDNPTIVPLGYDEMTRQTFGNKDFVVNAVQYLADDEGWMTLRNRTFTLRLLDKEKIARGTSDIKLIALAAPPVFVLIIGLTICIIRRYKFARKKK